MISWYVVVIESIQMRATGRCDLGAGAGPAHSKR